MGGLGKTTLAQLVYNHSLVEKSFDLRIWIGVSDPFDPTAIAKGILESIKKESSTNTNQMDVLLTQVKESTMRKKFLLVLDDVWTEDSNKWEPLRNSLEFGGVGSKILVTTRNERVVRMMGSRDSDIYCPGLLSDEDCWLLLCHIALSGRSGGEFENIGKDIAKKCNGLPLAAKTLGSLLQVKSSLDEWKNILNSEIWKMEEAEVDIFPHLLLSYNELSPTHKRCFSYCAVFPKDAEIDVENLIDNWMALGYLGSNMDNMELEGRECFDVLAMRSLFQDFEINDLDKKIHKCKMHDIVHDFAQFVRKSGRVESDKMKKAICQVCDPICVNTVNLFCSLDWDYKKSPPIICDCLTRARVLSMRDCPLPTIPQRMKILIHLRRLDMSENTLSQQNLKIIFRLYYLQTLRLVKCNLEDIPMEIGNLIHLRDLDLSLNQCLKQLPKEIGNLIHLRHLQLIFNESLKELPESMCGLHKLRTLGLQECESLSYIPKGLSQLTGLRELIEFRGGSGFSKLGLLKKLNHLSGDLKLYIRLGNDGFKEVGEDAREAELRNKVHLQKLEIHFEDVMDENEECDKVRIDVMDALEPHRKLQKLCIWKYNGSKFPLSWMVSPLNQLRFLELAACNQLSSLPPLGKLPCLEVLEIIYLEVLEFVGREFLGIGGGDVNIPSSSNTDLIAFPKLKKLTFYEILEWKEWEDITAEEEHHSTIMPCLEELSIFRCHFLTKLSRSLLSKAWPLENLWISYSEQLEQHCRENGVVFKSYQTPIYC